MLWYASQCIGASPPDYAGQIQGKFASDDGEFSIAFNRFNLCKYSLPGGLEGIGPVKSWDKDSILVRLPLTEGTRIKIEHWPVLSKSSELQTAAQQGDSDS